MNSFDSFKEALQKPLEVESIYRMDMSKKENMLTAEIVNLKNLESINLEKCPENFAFPEELAQLDKLYEVVIRGQGKFDIPKSLNRITHFEFSLKEGGTLGNIDNLQNVEKIWFRDCPEHVKIPAGIAALPKLKLLGFTVYHNESIHSISFEGEVVSNPFPALESLKMCDCAADISIPQAFAQASKLSYLRVSGGSDKTVPIPQPLRKLPVITLDVCRVEYESIFDFPAVEVMELLSCESPNRHFVKLGERFTKLRELTVFGCKLEDGALSPDIAKLQKLEFLEIVSSSLLTLPDTLAQMPALRTFSVRGNPIRSFPEVLTKSTTLQELYYNQQTPTLPPAIKNMTGLRLLNLSGALNNGVMLSSWDKTDNIKAVPPVISQLTWITELNLDCCGVLDLEAITPLKNLKKLSLKYSGVKELDNLAKLQELEELSIEKCDSITDISPISKLPKLRVLNLENTDIEDISPILECPTLEELNIERANDIKDLSPVFKHPNLKVLKANGDATAKFARRDEFQNMGTPSDILAAIRNAINGSTANAESVLEKMNAYIEAFSTGDSNAIDTIFANSDYKSDEQNEEDDEYMDDYYTTKLPELDALLDKHAAQLSSDVLAGVVESTLRSITSTCYTSTIPAVIELARRKDVEAQKRVVEAYMYACEYYDAGHRADEGTVQDQLIDDLFPDFEAEPLADLLEWCRGDHLYSYSGDRMDELFAPAMSRADEATKKRLEERLIAYYKQYLEYYGGEYFDKLFKDVQPYLSEEAKSLFEGMDEQNKLLKDINERIESKDAKTLENLIFEIGNTIPEKLFDTFSIELWYAIDACEEMNPQARIRYLDLQGRQKNGAVHPSVKQLTQLIVKNRKDAEAWMEKTYADKEVQSWLPGLLRCAIDEAAKNDDSNELREYLRQTLVKYDKKTYDEIRQEEIRQMFIYGMDYHSYGHENCGEVLQRAINEVNTLSTPLVVETEYNDTFIDAFVWMVEGGEYDKAIAVAYVLPKLSMRKRSLQRLLAQSIALAMMKKDEVLEKKCLALLPQEITWDILSYNLACLSAVNNNKSDLLKYAKLSIELGKSSKQFMNDSDFDAFKKDPDFLAAIDDSGMERNESDNDDDDFDSFLDDLLDEE